MTGPETTVLPAVRRLDPVGSEERFVAFSARGALAFVEGDSILDAPHCAPRGCREGRWEGLPFEAYHDCSPS